MAEHAKRQAIPVIRDTGVVQPPVELAPGPIVIPNAPVGHVDVMYIGRVYFCECRAVFISRGGLDEHHDRARLEQQLLGLRKARTSAQKITLAEIEDAFAKAGDE